jgi:polyphosphate glucokinase
MTNLKVLIVDGIVEPMQLEHLPYKKVLALAKKGKTKWRKQVNEVIELFPAALEAEEILTGGGNTGHFVPGLRWPRYNAPSCVTN